MRNLGSILASLFIHLLFVLMITNAPKFLKSTPTKNIEKEKIEFEVLVPQTNSAKANSGSLAKNKNKAALGKSGVNKKVGIHSKLKQLLPSQALNYQSSEKLLAVEQSFESSPYAPWGEQEQGALTGLKNQVLYEQLYNAIEGLTFYPSVLFRNNIEGTVKARLAFNDQGQCLWNYSYIKSRDKHLKVLILSILKKACAMNWREEFRSVSKNLVVDMGFQFRISDIDHIPVLQYQMSEHNFIVGNVMTFYRSRVDSVLQWELGPFTGIFPIPYVNINFDWLSENWDRVVKNKKDPLKEYYQQMREGT